MQNPVLFGKSNQLYKRNRWAEAVFSSVGLIQLVMNFIVETMEGRRGRCHRSAFKMVRVRNQRFARLAFRAAFPLPQCRGAFAETLMLRLMPEVVGAAIRPTRSLPKQIRALANDLV